MLATLLTRANAQVPVAELIDAIWPGNGPANPRAALQTYVTRVRQVLVDAGSTARVVGTDAGYRIDVRETAVDLGMFGALVRAADEAAERGDPTAEADALREALALWRGEPLAGVESEALLRDVVPRLTEWRLQVLQRRLDLDLRLGRHAEVVAELRTLTERYPLRERLWWLLMTALSGCGRRAEALEAYHEVRGHLADELGIDPGAELRELHLAVLNGEAVVAASAAPAPERAPERAPEPWVGQCRLPPVVPDFVGREASVAALLDHLRPIGGAPPTRVVTISGLPGSGKTALALHVAHALRADYPDGQWYVRLRGAGPDPRTPARVLDELLRTAGVEPEAIAADPAEREGALRARLADRRVLLVFDDAADAAQVLPVLPGTPGCAVLITSRATLDGLAALASARPHPLEPLDDADAFTLVARVLGPDRVRAEPAAVVELAALCGRLPLAMRIAMVNLIGRPTATIAGYVAELRGRDRLRRLSAAGDPQVAVRTAFDLSYASLPDPARHAFRLLGVLPAADFGLGAVAAAYGVDAAEARARLATLGAASLVDRHAADRFRLHDLTRLYAVERLDTDEPAGVRGRPRIRLLDWYLHTAHAAGAVLGHDAPPSPPPPPADGVPVTTFDSAEDALAWLDAERDNVVELIRSAAQHGPAAYAWRLFEAIQPDLRTRNHVDAWESAVAAALGATGGDPGPTARMRLSRGTLFWALGRFRDAREEMALALAPARHSADDTEIRVLNNLGMVHSELGEMDAAGEILGRALVVAESRAGDPTPYRSRILNTIGIVSLERGELERAREEFTLAYAASQEANLLYGQKMALDNLGEVHRELGEPDAAAEYFASAVALSRQLQGKHLEAASLAGLAGAHADAGRYAAAWEAARTSLAIAQELVQPRIEADAFVVLGQTAAGSDEPEAALRHYAQARDVAHRIGYRRAEVQALIGLTAAGGPVTHAERALTLAREGGLRLLEGRVRAAIVVGSS